MFVEQTQQRRYRGAKAGNTTKALSASKNTACEDATPHIGYAWIMVPLIRRPSDATHCDKWKYLCDARSLLALCGVSVGINIT